MGVRTRASAKLTLPTTHARKSLTNKRGIPLADIFLSYARADQARIEPIAAALEQAGYSVWWDRHIEGGSQFSKDIEKQIEEARAVIVIWSAASVESEWVRDEAAIARDADKLVPVTLDATLPPLGFRQRQAIDLSDKADDAASLSSLKAALDRLIGEDRGAIASAAVAKPKPPLALIAIPAVLLIAIAGFFLTRSNEPDVPVEVAKNEAPETPITPSNTDSRDSVAVLPFVAQSSSEDDQYFADGVTEEILNRLDAVAELRVLPRTTVFSFRDTKERLDTLTEKLGVDYIVEGSLRRGGDTVRVSARLVRGRDSETLWSNSYDGSDDDVLQFQSDIAEKVAGSLDVLLDEQTLKRMEDAGVDDPEAFSLYAKAFDMHQKGHLTIVDGMDSLYEASLLFDQAFEASPKLWRAPVNASDIYSHIIIDQAAGIEREELPLEARQNAQAEMQKRLDLARAAAPNRQEKLAIELYALGFSDDWSKIPELSREYYTNHDGCEVANWAGFLIDSLEGFDEIAEAHIRMEDCRAGDRLFAFFVVQFLAKSDRYDDARAYIDRERERGLIDNNRLDAMQAHVEHHAGDIDKAITLLDGGGRDFYRLNAKILQGGPSVIKELNDYLEKTALTPWQVLPFLATSGQRERANAYAALIDSNPGGPTTLQEAVDGCDCGAPFDIEVTPNYAAVLERSGISWPMNDTREWPMKDW